MRRVPALALVALPLFSPLPGRAASFAIDPDPASPTLSELLDREAKQRDAARPSGLPPTPAVPATPAPRQVRTEPVIPQGAVTVLTPGARLRDAGTRAFTRR